MNEFEISWSDKIRDIVELSGMTLHEISEKTNINYHTLKSWYYREKIAKPYVQDAILALIRNRCCGNVRRIL